MKNKPMLFHHITIISLVVFFFASVIYSFVASDNENTQLKDDLDIKEIKGWTLDGKKIDLPYVLPVTRSKEFTIKSQIPKDVDDKTHLMCMSNYCITKIYVDGKEIGSYGTKKVLPYGRMFGNIRIVIPLKKDYAKKEISMTINPMYTQDGMIVNPVKYAYKSDLVISVINENMWRVLVCVYLITMTIFGFIAVLYQLINGASHDNVKLCFFFSCLAGLICTWVICSSDIPQFFTNANEAVSFTSFLSLAIIGVVFIGYCREMLNKGKKILGIVEIGGCLVPFLVDFLFITGLVDPPDILILTHVYMIVVCSMAVFFTVKEFKSNEDSKVFVISMVFVVLASACGLICFYMLPNSGYDAVFFGGGFAIYILLLFFIVLSREIRFIKERVSVDLYKTMAYIDKMTGCGNRAALDKEVEEAYHKHLNDTITFFIADLNHLKVVNDKYGHDMGDKLICEGAKCLLETFAEHGSVYRLGGDEFAIVLWNQQGRIEQLYQNLEKIIEKHNSKSDVKVSMAKGYVEQKWTNDSEMFRKVYKEADEMMYIDKQLCHTMENVEEI